MDAAAMAKAFWGEQKPCVCYELLALVAFLLAFMPAPTVAVTGYDSGKTAGAFR